jgi:hypothetical protein
LPFVLGLELEGSLETFFLAFALGRRPMLLNHHYMIGVLLHAILGCFKHPMQLSHDLLHAIHMKVHNERLIAHRERLENHVSSQVILEILTRLVQGLNVTHHLDQTTSSSLHANKAFAILCHTRFLCQNQVLIVCMTQNQLFHTYGQKCSQITKCHE